MPISQRDIALQMLAQIRLIDPAVSAEVGTPERKIIDTVAQALADAQVDLTALASALDVDSKYGANLDRFLALFGFGRQRAIYASGFVTFGRPTASTVDIRVPAGTQVMAPRSSSVANVDAGIATDDIGFTEMVFSTTSEVTLLAGETKVVAPIRANVTGPQANFPAGRIITFYANPVLGITTVTNEAPTSGGRGAETDDELKVRFKNTIFRNLAGTEDQYLANAASMAFSSKANIIGPQSRYREYVQVPYVDDTTSYDINSDGILEVSTGTAGEYTSALSTNPFAKYIYNIIPFFVSNGQSGISAIFYRPETDFRLNTSVVDRNKGDTLRMANATPPIGSEAGSADAAFQPNVTFMNVYTGVDPAVTAIRPGDILLLEYGYMSKASRNDFDRGISNCVDVYIDGENIKQASAIIPRPNSGSTFVNNSLSKFYYENYRRIGEPKHRPLIGNVFTPLFWQPVTALPIRIIISGITTHTYTLGTHYWPIEDVSEYRGTVRARNGIEWSMDERGVTGDNSPGLLITEHSSSTTVEIENYLFDQNIIDLQAILNSSKQVTTDVLAHKAKTRRFKFDVSVMYNPGSPISDINANIRFEIDRFLRTSQFGNVVQLSDILQVIHNAGGVDNVRWSADSDIAGSTQLHKVYEVDNNGKPLVGIQVDRFRKGTSSLSEIQQIVLTGTPTSGSFNLLYNGVPTDNIPYNTTTANLVTKINTATTASVNTITGSGKQNDPWVVTFNGTGSKALFVGDATLVTALTQPTQARPLVSAALIDGDFFLNDDELPALPDSKAPGDTLAGLVIRPRAQHTWRKN